MTARNQHNRGAHGVRLDPVCQERTRAKIDTMKLIGRLQRFAQGKCEMSNGQVNAALGLIRKTLPDLQATELTGKDGGAISIRSVLSELEGRSRGIPSAPPEKQDTDQPLDDTVH